MKKTFEIITPGGRHLTMTLSGDTNPEVASDLKEDDLELFVGGQIEVQNLGEHGGPTKFFKGEIGNIKLIVDGQDRMLSVQLNWAYDLDAEWNRIPVDRIAYYLPLEACCITRRGRKVMIHEGNPTRLSRVLSFEETEGDFCVLIPPGDKTASDYLSLESLNRFRAS